MYILKKFLYYLILFGSRWVSTQLPSLKRKSLVGGKKDIKYFGTLENFNMQTLNFRSLIFALLLPIFLSMSDLGKILIQVHTAVTHLM